MGWLDRRNDALNVLTDAWANVSHVGHDTLYSARRRLVARDQPAPHQLGPRHGPQYARAEQPPGSRPEDSKPPRPQSGDTNLVQCPDFIVELPPVPSINRPLSRSTPSRRVERSLL